MKQLVVIFILFCGVNFKGYSQGRDPDIKNYVDSLKTELKKEQLSDTSKIGLLFEIGYKTWLFRTGYWDTIVQLSQNALLKYSDAKTKLWLEKKLGSCYNNLGYIYKIKGDNNKALELFEKGALIQQKCGDKENEATALTNIGTIYDESGNIEKALDYFQRSINIQEQIDDKKGIALNLNNIAAIYKYQDDAGNAMTYFNKSLTIYEELKDKRGIGICYNNIGSIYQDNADYKKSIEYFEKSLKIRNEIGDISGASQNLQWLGSAYIALGDTAKGVDYSYQGLTLLETTNDKLSIVYALNNIAGIEIKRKNYKKAFEVLTKALPMGKELGNPTSISTSSKQLYYIYKQRNQFKDALEMYETYIQMRDSIKNEETQKAAIRQQTKYEFEKEQLIAKQIENENLRIKNENIQRRNNLQYSIILVAILAVFGLVLSLGFIKVGPKVAEGLIFFAFLILFEFLLVLCDPYIDRFSNGEPAYKLLSNALLAGLIFPIHSFFENKLKNRLIKFK